MAYKLWDFLDARFENAIRSWGLCQSRRDQAKVDQRLDRLAQVEFSLAIATKLLAGPLRGEKHIYKMQIHGEVQLRPMLCKGPHDMDSEYTLLTGAIERNRKLDTPPSAAEANRQTVLNNKTRRCKHERIKT